MVPMEPITEIDSGFSSSDASAIEWVASRRRVQDAKVFWLSTVRPDGRPHVTPLTAVWLDEAMHFCSGVNEQKSRNLALNPYAVLTTGTDDPFGGRDVLFEGSVEVLKEENVLRRIAEAYVSKYGEEWRFEVRDGAFHGRGDPALVYRLRRFRQGRTVQPDRLARPEHAHMSPLRSRRSSSLP